MERGGLRAAAVLAACCAAVASAISVEGHVPVEAKHASSGKMVPPLDPESHTHFFKSDYPEDLSPERRDDFAHPFPIVQDGDEYDKDYVKDENSDGGEWKYQNEYDTLRGKLAQAKANAKKALKLESTKEKELDSAKAKEADARAKAKAALEAKIAKEKEAEEKLKDAEKDLDGVGKGPGGGPVERATAKVESEVKDLAACEKELEDARAKLKKLQEERKAAEAMEAEREAASEAAEAAQIARMKKEEELEGKVKSEATEYKTAHDAYVKEAKSLEELEKEFKDAEAKLRQFRRKGVDPDGGVYRSGATRAALPGPLKPLAAWSAVVAVALSL